MRAVSFFLGVLVFSNAILAADVEAKKERAFWKLFQKHEGTLYEEPTGNEKVLAHLQQALEKVHPKLVMEIGPKPEKGPRKLTLSANGALEAFPVLFFLADGAPHFEHWEIQKFRPRQNVEGNWEVDGQTYEVEKIHYLLYSVDNNKKVGIMLFFPGYRAKEKEHFEVVARQILYRALGEFDATTRIGAVIARDPGSHFFEESHPLPLLPENFDEHFQNLQ